MGDPDRGWVPMEDDTPMNIAETYAYLFPEGTVRPVARWLRNLDLTPFEKFRYAVFAYLVYPCFISKEQPGALTYALLFFIFISAYDAEELGTYFKMALRGQLGKEWDEANKARRDRRNARREAAKNPAATKRVDKDA